MIEIPHYSLKHAAAFIGVSDSTMRAWIRKKKIFGHKNSINGFWYFSLTEINRVRQEFALEPLSEEEAHELWRKY